MRSFKRIIALAMVAMVLVSAFALNAFASEEGDYSEAANRLGAIGILKGDNNGNLMLDQGVERWHAALFFVQATTGHTEAEKWNEEKQSAYFNDVPEYGTAIDYAYDMELIRGRGDGTYGYRDAITYQDMLVMAVRALGYETEDMKYPLGYIEAAKKLKLNRNLASDIRNTDALTRGETAQIIWNMLNTHVAETDPYNGKIIYPGDTSAMEALFQQSNYRVPRTYLIEQVGFTQGEITGTIIAYNKAQLSSEISHVVVRTATEDINIATSDLGITARTNPSTFLGLPVTLYVDCAADKFSGLYNMVEEESEAKIVIHQITQFNNVVNVGDQTNIKYYQKGTENRIVIDGNTYSDAKYTFEFYTLTANGWKKDTVSAPTTRDAFYAAFAYDTDENEYTGTNSYGEVDYAVVTEEVSGTTVDKLLILYKPYEFGQYYTREFKYQPTSSAASFITIGKYDPFTGYYDITSLTEVASWKNKDAYPLYKNPDNKPTYFREYLLGTNVEVNVDTASVSKANGEAARDAKLSGESVRAGDFIFYYYNALDNVLEIGYNCGGMKTGTINAKIDKETAVKIDGTKYTFGFEGAFDTSSYRVPDATQSDQAPYANKACFVYNTTVIDTLINLIETDVKNVHYIAVNDHVVFAQYPVGLSNYRVKTNYVITTTDAEIMAGLLGLDYSETTPGTMDPTCEYARKLTSEGVYVAKSGNMNIAVLNTTSGKWELAEVSQYECGRYNAGGIYVTSTQHYDYPNAEFPYTVDVAAGIKNLGIFGSSYNGAANDTAVIAELVNGGMFAVRNKSGNVYKLCPMFGITDWGMINNGIVTDGLYFSENPCKTNKLLSSRAAGVDPARVTLTEDTVVVIIDENDNVGVRKGLQSVENGFKFTYTVTNIGTGAVVTGTEKTDVINAANPGSVYSATNKLIVMKLPKTSSVTYTPGSTSAYYGNSYTITCAIDTVTDALGNTGAALTVATWQGAAQAGTDETYYIVTNDGQFSYEKLNDGTFDITVSGLFNLKTMRAVSSIKVNVESLNDTNLDTNFAIGTLLKMDKYGKLNVDGTTTLDAALLEAVKMRGTSYKNYVTVDLTDGDEFVDDCSVTMDEFTYSDGTTTLDKAYAIGSIEVNVATVNATTFDNSKYDFDNIIYDGEAYNASNAWGAGYTKYKDISSVEQTVYTYYLDSVGSVEKITEPLAGVLDQYTIYTAGKTLKVSAVNEETFANPASIVVDLHACGEFDAKTGKLTLYVLKVIG